MAEIDLFLVNDGLAQMRRDLVDAPAEHHVTAQEQREMAAIRSAAGSAAAAARCLASVVAWSGPYRRRLSRSRNSLRGLVLRISAFSSQPRRA